MTLLLKQEEVEMHVAGTKLVPLTGAQLLSVIICTQ